MSEMANVIRVTTNYEDFRFWRNNRNPVRYDKLIKSCLARRLLDCIRQHCQP